MADCFVVDDRLWVHESEEENGGCIVAVTFQIRFIKGTMFRRIIEGATRKEYDSFWSQFGDMVRSLKGPMALEEEELEEVAMELEEATAILVGEGLEVDLSSALSRIRDSSRRLAKLPSTRKMTQLGEVEERPSLDMQNINMQNVVSFVLDGIAYLRKQLSESGNGFALACAVFFFMFLLNILSVRQMTMMNRFLQNLDRRLEKMNEVNELLLLKLANGECL